MFKRAFCLTTTAAMSITWNAAVASPCRDKALNLMRAYGLSETLGQGTMTAGTGSGTEGADPRPGKLSDSQQLSPLQAQKIQPEVKQAIAADESGNSAACNAKMAEITRQIKQAK